MAYGSALVDNVQSSTVGVAPAFKDGGGSEIGQLCKAWVNFNGTTGAIRASFNVSSVIRNAAGDYTLNFTTAFADANYSTLVTGSKDASYAFGLVNYNKGVPTTQFVYVSGYNTAGSLNDGTYMNVSIFR